MIDFLLHSFDAVVGACLTLVYTLKPLLDLPGDFFQYVRSQPESTKVAVALGVYLFVTVSAWLWKRARRVLGSPANLVRRMEGELVKERAIHASIIDFNAYNNVLLARILLLGFLYVAGTKLDSFAHVFDRHVLGALGEWLPVEVINAVRILVRDYLQPALYFICAILLSRTCNRFWAFNKRHRDFAAYCDRLLALIDRQKARMNPLTNPLRGIAAPDGSEKPGTTPSTRRTTPVPPPPRPGRNAQRESPVLWTMGKIASISQDRRGTIEAVSAVRRGIVTDFEFDVRRFATVEAVEQDDPVLFLEHPTLTDNNGSPAAYLIAPLGRIGYGVVMALSKAGNRACLVDVRDSCGNSAAISVETTQVPSFSTGALRVGDRVSFTFGEERSALVGTNGRKVLEGTGLDLASADF